MKQKIAIWLLPDKEDSRYLSRIIKTLGKKYDAPFFVPHLSVYTNLKIEIEKAKKVINDVTKSIKPFDVETNRINFTKDNIWKSLFLEIHINKELMMIYQSLRRRFLPYTDYQFRPHISLMYKLIPIEEKKRIIDTLKINKTFTMEALAINYEEEGFENWKLISPRR